MSSLTRSLGCTGRGVEVGEGVTSSGEAESLHPRKLRNCMNNSACLLQGEERTGKRERRLKERTGVTGNVSSSLVLDLCSFQLREDVCTRVSQQNYHQKCPQFIVKLHTNEHVRLTQAWM